MVKYIIVGAGFAFAAAVQPGPFQAYLLSRVASSGWRRTLPAALAPLLSDGPIAFLALFVLGRLSPSMQRVLRSAGGVLLLYFAWRTLTQWRRPAALRPERDGKIPRTLLEAALVNILNPNPYLGWTLVLGPAVVAAWRQSHVAGVAVVAAFYVTLTSMVAVTIVAFGTARFLGPKLQRGLLLASAVVLAGLGVYQLSVSLVH
jgi:threonine/homoserine/homoserine lactone efflux protein